MCFCLQLGKWALSQRAVYRVIRNSVHGVQAAKAAGMTVFAFLGGSHVNGVAHAVETEKPDLIFDDMAQLPRMIEDYN